MNSYNYASRSKRFLNWAIDGSVVTTVWAILIILIAPHMIKMGLFDWMEKGRTYDFSFTILPVYFLYYLILEGYFKTTIGKMITRTKLIRVNGDPITFGDVVARTIFRFIPLEQLSYLTENPVGLHDSLSNTRLLRQNDR